MEQNYLWSRVGECTFSCAHHKIHTALVGESTFFVLSQIFAVFRRYDTYGKCSKILNISIKDFLYYKMLGINARNYKILVRIANRENADQTASSEVV